MREPPTTEVSSTTDVAPDALDDRYVRLRLVRPGLVERMAKSLRRYGQLSPVVACTRDSMMVLVDGFKRAQAARKLGWKSLLVRHLDLTDRAAVAAVYGLNRDGRGLVDLEEAFVVRELVRTHGLTQPEVGELLGRHKSWVCRRLMLVERLCEEVQDDVRAGLVPVTVAREVARLPRGNQPEVAAAVHRHGLSTRDATLLVKLFEQTTERAQQEALLEQPREILEAHRGGLPATPTDPRLGAAANRLRRQALWVHEGLTRLDRLLPAVPTSEWTDAERRVLADLLHRVGGTASRVGQAIADVTRAMEGPDGRRGS